MLTIFILINQRRTHDHLPPPAFPDSETRSVSRSQSCRAHIHPSFSCNYLLFRGQEVSRHSPNRPFLPLRGRPGGGGGPKRDWHEEEELCIQRGWRESEEEEEGGDFLSPLSGSFCYSWCVSRRGGSSGTLLGGTARREPRPSLFGTFRAAPAA